MDYLKQAKETANLCEEAHQAKVIYTLIAVTPAVCFQFAAIRQYYCDFKHIDDSEKDNRPALAGRGRRLLTWKLSTGLHVFLKYHLTDSPRLLILRTS